MEQPAAISIDNNGTTSSKSSVERAKELVRKNEKETIAFFGPPSSAVLELPVADDNESLMLRMSSLYNDLYRGSQERDNAAKNKNGLAASAKRPEKRMRTVLAAPGVPDSTTVPDTGVATESSLLTDAVFERVQQPITRDVNGAKSRTSSALIVSDTGPDAEERQRLRSATSLALRSSGGASALSTSLALAADRPEWHAPWRMFRSISGHLGWVRCVAVDPTNDWFATGSSDRTIKIWDVATGNLKLTLTGHIAAVRGVAVSARHPYMFSVGEDKTVKCWDLEHNKVIRSYHGHLSGVYCVALHPELDVLLTGGRDSAVRVWDMRSRAQVFALTGHRDSINGVVAQANDPQVISASVDSTVRLWDLAAGKCATTLTNHKRGVRGLAMHPREFSFASASMDNIKTWGLPEGTFIRNFGGKHKKLVNCLAVNEDGVMVSGGDDGAMCMWDWKSAHCFQDEQTIVQPGSLECEAAIYAMEFDKSGSRLITCEADKTIKMWKEDSKATPETHPLNWKPNLRPQHY